MKRDITLSQKYKKMGIEIELIGWAKKVSENKSNLDRGMFDDLMKLILVKLDKDGYDDTMRYLNKNYEGGTGSRMVGVHLFSTNSKQIKDKLWSLNKKQGGRNEKER